MKVAAFAVAAVALLTAAACGGNSKEPLSLQQRVSGAAEAPGSRPDPREQRRTVEGSRKFAEVIGPGVLINPNPKDLRAFRKTGFIAAVEDTRFFPPTPGAAHTGTEPHERTLVMRFTDHDGAEKSLALLHTDRLRPCPEECAFQVAQFEVSGIPGAMGVRRFATKEKLAATGGKERRPFELDSAMFVDGDFLYDVTTFGALGAVSPSRAEAIAKKLYDRVKGAPAPSGGS